MADLGAVRRKEANVRQADDAELFGQVGMCVGVDLKEDDLFEQCGYAWVGERLLFHAFARHAPTGVKVQDERFVLSLGTRLRFNKGRIRK